MHRWSFSGVSLDHPLRRIDDACPAPFAFSFRVIDETTIEICMSCHTWLGSPWAFVNCSATTDASSDAISDRPEAAADAPRDATLGPE